MRTTILAAVAALSLSACTIPVKPVDFAETHQPAAAQKHQTRVALAVPAQFSGYHHVGSPDGISGGLRTFDFELGRPMADALRTRLGSSFTLVPEGQADITITPAFESFRFTLDDDQQALRSAAYGIFGAASTIPSAITELGLRLDAVDAVGKPVSTVRTKGLGLARNNALSFNMEREFTTSAGVAIDNTSTKAVQALLADPAVQAKLSELDRR